MRVTLKITLPLLVLILIIIHLGRLLLTPEEHPFQAPSLLYILPLFEDLRRFLAGQLC